MENRCGLHLPWSLTAFYIYLMSNITFCFGKNSHLFCIQNLLDRKLLLMSWKIYLICFFICTFSARNLMIQKWWLKNWMDTHTFFLPRWRLLLQLFKYTTSYVSKIPPPIQFSSVQSFSHVWLFVTPWHARHARPPCPSLTPRIYSNSCPLSQWCHLTISSSVIPFSCLQSFPASGSFQMNQFFASGGQSTGISALASILPMNTQDWSPLGWTGWISLQSKGLSRVFSPTPQFKSINSLELSFLYSSTLTFVHDYWKNHSFD